MSLCGAVRIFGEEKADSIDGSWDESRQMEEWMSCGDGCVE